MKTKLLFALMTVAFVGKALASADLADPREQIYTQGTADFPARLTVINDGQKKIYHPSFDSKSFTLSQDRVFQMGPSFHCAPPYLGKTAEALDIPIRVEWRVNDVSDGQSAHAVGPVGPALLIVPAGTDVYGVCRQPDLISLTMQVAEPSAFFEIAWKKQLASELAETLPCYGTCFETGHCSNLWFRREVTRSGCARLLGRHGRFGGSWQEARSQRCEPVSATGASSAQCLNPFRHCD